MIQMNRNHIGFFRGNGRGSLRDAPPCNQPGNRQLRPDHGNRGIDCNVGRLAQGEILRHLGAVGACCGLGRASGIIHGISRHKTTGRLINEEYTTPMTSFGEPRKEDRNSGQESKRCYRNPRPGQETDSLAIHLAVKRAAR
jgi:hypothetical protein